MFKTIKAIYNVFAEVEAKEKARRKFVSKMSVEEYRAYKGASYNIQQRKNAIDYQKSRCSSTSEYNLNPVKISYEIVGVRKDPVRRKAFGGWGLCHYEDDNQYKVTKTVTPSINQQIKTVESSKDFNIIQNLINKYN